MLTEDGVGVVADSVALQLSLLVTKSHIIPVSTVPSIAKNIDISSQVRKEKVLEAVRGTLPVARCMLGSSTLLREVKSVL